MTILSERLYKLLYRGGYAAWGRWLVMLLVAVMMSALLAGCSSHRRSVRFPRPAQGGEPVNVEFAHLSAARQRLISEAQEWVGTPYAYARCDKGRGSDCSGMVLQVYLDALGIKLPRNSAEQAAFCTPIGLREVLPGDLVFFATGKDAARISHVGIMLDYENFIHVSTSKGAVISKITTPYYVRTFMGFGRVPSL